ncbi:MAG: hypothetical protein NTZ15_10265 [Burkholderiales bacterium]|nr:hypothetical protein [Burkholderiales bacterium]
MSESTKNLQNSNGKIRTSSKVKDGADSNGHEVRFSRDRQVPSYKTRQAEVEERKLRQKEVEVAQLSAHSAHKSARWAAWAVVIALVALVVGAWQQFGNR